MNQAHYRIALDVDLADAQVQLICRRGDTSRVLRVTLTERGRPYQIGADCVAEFAARLPDGTLLKNACAIENGLITYRFTPRTTAQAGVLECEVRLLDGDGQLLVSPRFTLAVYGTVYNDGDAVAQEGPSSMTVKSTRPGYSQVFLWSDGNPQMENRLGLFVSPDENRSSAMITRANGESQVIGVTAAIPGFAADAGQEKFGPDGQLGDAYEYVTMLGFVPVQDNGLCAVNGRCRPGSDGTAVPCGAGGFYVVERIDENHVTILMTADGDLGIRMAEDLNKRQWKLGWVTRDDIDAMLAGTYEGVEDENPEEFDGVLFAVQP